MKRGVFWLMLLGTLVIGLTAGPGLWAAPGQDSARQTVPTRTPQTPPTSQPSKPKDQPTPTPVATATEAANAPAAESSEPLLPSAGGRSLRLPLFGVLVAIGLVVFTAVRRFV
jgi:hypothetical protein